MCGQRRWKEAGNDNDPLPLGPLGKLLFILQNPAEMPSPPLGSALPDPRVNFSFLCTWLILL